MLFVERIPENEYVTFGRKESFEQARILEEHIQNKLLELKYTHKIIRVNQKTPIKEILEKIGIDSQKLFHLK